MELFGRRRVRAGWPGSHKPPESVPKRVLKPGQVRWRDDVVQGSRGYCSFLDLQASECDSPLNVFEGANDVAALLWYQEDDFASAGRGADSDDSDTETRIIQAICDQNVSPSPKSTTFPSRRTSYEELMSHDKVWSSRRPSHDEPHEEARVARAPSLPLLSPLRCHLDLLRCHLDLRPHCYRRRSESPRARSCGTSPLPPLHASRGPPPAADLVQRLAALLAGVRNDDDDSPNSVISGDDGLTNKQRLLAAFQLYSRATVDQQAPCPCSTVPLIVTIPDLMRLR